MTAGAFLQQLQECNIKIRTINAECISGVYPDVLEYKGTEFLKK